MSIRLWFLLRAWWLAALFPIAYQLYVTLHHLKFSWDDAAITASFSRTWAESGLIALTPVSQAVEGYSSISWFLLLSVPYFFTHYPEAGLIWMKILSALFVLLSLPLMYAIAMRQFSKRLGAAVAVIMLAFCFTSHQEIQNGMEMSLAVFLTLLLFHVLTRERQRGRVLFASATGYLLLLTRFEIPFVLALLLAGFAYAAYRKRAGFVTMTQLIQICLLVAIGFSLLTLWRHHVFGEWMPNTVYAKRFIPYKDWSTPAKFLGTRLTAMNEPLRVLRFPITIALVACLLAVYRKKLSWSLLKLVHPAIWMLAFGCFLFGAIFGRNWGHPGRMVAAMIPFLILACIGVCVSAVQDRRMLTNVLALMLTVHFLVWLRHAIQPVGIVRMTEIEPVGLGADAIRIALHQDNLVVMMSDVGASSLCCERLAIVDSGLLADTTLAHTGWQGFATYFRKVRPEVVETHYFWATDENIYADRLLDGYSIVASDGVRFFVRQDLYEKLAGEHAGPIMPAESVPACMAIYPEDNQFSRDKKTCLVLNGPEVQHNPG